MNKKENKQDWEEEFCKTMLEEMEKFIQEQLTKAREEAVKDYLMWSYPASPEVREHEYRAYLKSLDKPQERQGWHGDSDVAWGRGMGVTRGKKLANEHDKAHGEGGVTV